MGKGKPSRLPGGMSDMFLIFFISFATSNVTFAFAAMALYLRNAPRICHDHNLKSLQVLVESPRAFLKQRRQRLGPGAGNFSDPSAFGRLTSALKTVPSKDVIFRNLRVFTSCSKQIRRIQPNRIESIRFLETQTFSSAPWTTCYAS